jgi:serine phosphatase RsbU (regulator of sigma subunit)/putative methionine-R-sulfoxide reductase with GAF domain
MMQQPTARRASGSDRRIRLYGLSIGLAGWLWLLYRTDWRVLRANLWPLLLLAVLSGVVKGLGLRVSQDITYSLAGVVDLAAVWAYGPATGAWAATLGSLSDVAMPILRSRRLPQSFSALAPIFISGLSALLALTCGDLYLRLGGAIPPTVATGRLSLPLFAAVVVRFGLGSALRFGRTLLRDGLTLTLQSVQQALPLALLIELLPLPLSALVSLAHVEMGLSALMLWGLALVACSAVVQRLGEGWDHQQERDNQQRVLDGFGRALMEAQLDTDELCRLLHEYAQQVVQMPTFVLELLQPDRERVDVVVTVQDGATKPRRSVPLTETMRWLVQNRQPYLSGNVHQDGLPFELHSAGELPQSMLLVPLLNGADLIGAFSLQSQEAQAFDQDDVSVLLAIGSQAARAIANARAFAAAQQHAIQLAAISQVGQRVAAVRELNELFAYVVQLIRETFGYDHVGLFTVDARSHEVLFQASTDPLIQAQGVQVSQDEGGIVAWVAEAGESVLANDVSLEPRYRWADVLPETQAELAVPLRIEERIVGVLDVQSNKVDAFGPEDLFTLQTLADQVAVAVENARLFEARQEEAWSSTALWQLSEAVSRLDSLDDILEATVRLTPVLVGVDRCSLVLWQEGTREFVAAQEYAVDEELGSLWGEARIEPGDVSLLDQLRAEREPVLLEERDETTPAAYVDAFGTMLALPLNAQGEFQGALLADYVDPEAAFSDRTWTLLTGIADQVAMAIANARLSVAQREEAWVSTALLQAAQALTQSTALDESLSGIARLVPLLVGVDHCMILLWDGAKEEFRPGAAHGLNREAEEAFQGLHVQSDEAPALHQSVQQRQTLTLEDAGGDGLGLGLFGAACECRSCVIMPMMSKNEVLGVLLAGYTEGPRRFSIRNISIVEGIGHQTAIAIENARLYEATLEQERTAQELHMAREIQISFLPEESPSLPGWEIAADWRAAREIGGDFYDFIPLDTDHLGMIIADVSDKGMPAALFMSLCRTLVRVSASGTASPAEALQHVNAWLVAENRSGMFLTAFYGVLNWRTGQLRFANAGHNPPLLQRRGDPVTVRLTAKGTVLGVLDSVALEERQVSIGSGEMLILYTDGVTEPINALEEEFGEARLLEVTTDNFEQPCARILEAIHSAVSEFVGARPQFDDYTLVALKRAL